MDGKSSSSSRKSWHEDEFTDLLLSWSVEDIIDEDLYKDQVQKIPETFESVDQYLDAYVFPLLEEVRCELASAMKALVEAPFCEIISVRALKHEELLYDVKVDHWRNCVREGGREAYTTFSGSFVLISDSKPCDTRHAGSSFSLAFVRKVSELESGYDCTSYCLRLKTAHSMEDGDKKSNALYMVYLTNMTAQKRIWSALRMHKNLKIIEKVLTKNDSEESGNFNEAAEIARSLGNIPREIDLLEKGEKFEDACMLILLFVVSRSLWVPGNQGWQLKSFPEKVKFLDRAMWISRKVSGKFHASICVEAEVLLHRQRNLSELNQSYIASKNRGSLTGEVLCVRKLLDGHFERKPREYLLDSVLHVDRKSFHDILSRNQVSVGSLVFVWNLWRVQTMKILECLDSNKKSDFMKSDSTVEFCFNYFGAGSAKGLMESSSSESESTATPWRCACIAASCCAKNSTC